MQKVSLPIFTLTSLPSSTCYVGPASARTTSPSSTSKRFPISTLPFIAYISHYISTTYFQQAHIKGMQSSMSSSTPAAQLPDREKHPPVNAARAARCS